MNKFITSEKQTRFQDSVNTVSIVTIAIVTTINIFLIFRLLKITRDQETKEFLQNGTQANIESTLQDEKVSPPLQPQNNKTLRWPEIITAASTVILAVITAIYAFLTFSLVKTTQDQIELVQEPILIIEPATMVNGEIANFRLNVNNRGVTDVSDIEIYEDYFVALKPPDEPLTLYRFGMLNLFPDTTIPFLETGGSIEFPIEFAEIHSQMIEFFQSDKKGARMRIVRLLFKFRRDLDGREFETYKVYIVGGKGDVLIGDSPRQLNYDRIPLSLEEVKSVLGVE